VRVCELDDGGEAGKWIPVCLRGTVVGAAFDLPACRDKLRIVGEGEDDFLAVSVAADVGTALAVLLAAPLAGAFPRTFTCLFTSLAASSRT
jgi:hypothetical protein